MNEMTAYFQSEAARPFVSATDYAFDVAVSRINEDGGKSFGKWLETADDMVKTAIRAAYEAENAKNRAAHAAKMEAARNVFAEVLAGGASKTKALKAAQAVYRRFEISDAKATQ